MTPHQIKHMVSRFLQWKLPESFNPDGGISFQREFNTHTAFPSKHEPVGTNLLDAMQAEAMVHHMLDGLPPSDAVTIVAKVDASEALATIQEANSYPFGAYGDVLAERTRQVMVKRWTPSHDDTHDAGELAAAGSCYALSAAVILNPYTQGDGVEESTPPYAWPWGAEHWKINRADPRRALVKAAALLIAEIERIDRQAARP